MIRFEALNAKHGDALLIQYPWKNRKRLWIIDGGPKGVWKQTLKPRLEELRGDDSELAVDLAMLSHVDEDHVTGILQMTKGLAEQEDGAADFLEIKRFWHNSFRDIVGSSASLQAGMTSLAGTQAKAEAAMTSADPQLNIGNGSLDQRAVAVLASIGQGRELRDYLTKLQLSGNEPFGGTLSSKSGSKVVDGAKVTLVGPIKSRLDAFRQKWKSESGNAAALAALFRDDLDESPTNLSSLVMLVEIAKRKILLTGDARGDDIVDGFKDAGLDLPSKLDILKMPHHGSDRNITEKFLRSFPAKHYVISADGKYGNPDSDTIENIVSVRGDGDYTLHFTNDVKGLKTQLTKLQKTRSFEFEIRAKSAPSLAIELG
jgi:beta-lactamase superfamily II metal-dependent hydrolase